MLLFLKIGNPSVSDVQQYTRMKKEHKTLSQDELFELAVKKLVKSFLSEQKMVEFLKKNGASKEDTRVILEKLQRCSLLNEDEFIKNIISYCDNKHYGYSKIILMLKERKINDKKIKNVKKDNAREIKQSNLLLETLIKRYKNKNTVNLRRSVYLGLIRYGFDENLASSLVEKVYNSPQKELNMVKLEYEKTFSSYSRKLKGIELKVKITKKLQSKGYRIEDINKVIKENINETC